MKAPYPYCPSCSIFHDPAKVEEFCGNSPSKHKCAYFTRQPTWRCEFAVAKLCPKAEGKNPCFHSKERPWKSRDANCDYAWAKMEVHRPVVDTLTGGE